ncbi:MAG TPA: FecR domain-containing protein [Flavisolibacter sp.]|nr:FecR domain-containing protein [Flavisolibacter sp.]
MKESRLDYSDEKAHRIAYLIAGFIRKTLTEEEHDELDAWVVESDENMKLFEDLTDEDHLEANLDWMDSVQTEKRLAQTLAKMPKQPVQERKRQSWWPYLAAASVILLIGGFFFWRSEKNLNVDDPKTIAVTTDVAPGGSKAVLILGDGRVISLDSAKAGSIGKDGETLINKTAEGSLVYEAGTLTALSVAINTLQTPRGGQYAIQLPDGSKVWLNAESTLTFPVAFTGRSREVELTGEAYFEIANNSSQPFFVFLPDSGQVEVVGTQFNVNSYSDETVQTVTLREGSVLVKSRRYSKHIKPGQQLQISKGTISFVSNANPEAALGWKDGSFVFYDDGIEEIMRQLQRWYDVEVVFKTKTSEHFNTTISRKEPLSKVLRVLELTGKIHFKLENKTVYVLP